MSIITSTSNINYINIDNDKICRTCLTNLYGDSINIFEERRNNTLIAELLTECISLTIKQHDGFPIQICSNCVKKLDEIIEFRVMATQSNETLQNFQKTAIDNVECKIIKEEVLENDHFAMHDTNLTPTTVDSDERNAENVNEVIAKTSIDEKPVLAELKDEKTSEFDEIDEDLLKNIDLSEYEHLKSTLTRSEKKKTRVLCKLCNKSVLFYYFFEEHLPQHLGKVPFKCDICDKGFVSKSVLNQHKASHTDNRSHTCDVCNKSFKTRITLLTHRRIHSTDNKHECDVCKKKFKHNYILISHKRIHSDEKQYTCVICGRSFTNYSNLCRHTKTHDVDKNFMCSECGKAFKTKIRLNEHCKRHTGYKPYKCSYCERSFGTSTVLKNHVAIHTGIRAYVCKICDKSFTQRITMQVHMKTHKLMG